MYMHLRFKDGSNPYLTMHLTAQQIKRKYNQFAHATMQPGNARLFPLNSVVTVHSVSGRFTLRQSGAGEYAIFETTERGFEQQATTWYCRFGNAVNALGRLNEKYCAGLEAKTN